VTDRLWSVEELLETYGRQIMKAGTIVFLALAITISGCSDAAEDNQAMQAAAENNQARSDMMQAKNAYTKCLQENNADPRKCAGFKEAYEVDLQAYRATSGGSVSGAVVNFGGPTMNSNQPSKPQQLEEQRQRIQQLKEQQETE
jgi:hypothetical protein